VTRSGTGQDRVYQALRTRILEHQLEPGSRISISGEAQRLGVSQTPVREALNRLEGDELVVRVASRGYAVTPLIDREQLAELFELRLLLEPWAAGEAATSRLRNPARLLREELEVLERLHGTEQSVQAQRALSDQRFHEAIVDAAGNGFLATAVDRLHAHVHVFRLHQIDAEGRETYREHAAILAAVEACDPTAAEAAMRAHLHGAFQRLSAPARTAPDGADRSGGVGGVGGTDGGADGSGGAAGIAPRAARSHLR